MTIDEEYLNYVENESGFVEFNGNSDSFPCQDAKSRSCFVTTSLSLIIPMGAREKETSKGAGGGRTLDRVQGAHVSVL